MKWNAMDGIGLFIFFWNICASNFYGKTVTKMMSTSLALARMCRTCESGRDLISLNDAENKSIVKKLRACADVSVSNCVQLPTYWILIQYSTIYLDWAGWWIAEIFVFKLFVKPGIRVHIQNPMRVYRSQVSRDNFIWFGRAKYYDRKNRDRRWLGGRRTATRRILRRRSFDWSG